MSEDQPMDFEKWWAYYRSLKRLHNGNEGTKKKAKTAWDKHYKPEQYQKIYDDTLILARYDIDRLMKNEKPSIWPHGSSFLNPSNGYLEREVGSYADLNQRYAGSFCKCGKNADHAKLGMCWGCYEKAHVSPFIDDLRAAYVKNKVNLALTPEDHRKLQKQIARGFNILPYDKDDRG